MNKFLFQYFLLLAVFILSFKILANEESDYLKKARERHYVGGAEESDLKVQKVIVDKKDEKNKKNDNEESSEGF